MAKKIKTVTCFIIALIIVGAALAIAVVNEKSIDVVKSVVMSENTSSSVKISWNKVKGADGYHLYAQNEKSGKFEKIGDINDGEICSYDFKNIDSGKIYKIKVTAFKIFNKKEYESEDAEIITAYSMPDVLELSAFSSYEGVLDAKWDEQKNASGYELEYSKNEDFSDSKKETIAENVFQAEQLKPKDVYYVRVRAYIEVNKKKIFGEWCDSCRVEIKEKVVMPADIDPKKPIVALSFDDGPAFSQDGVNSTEEILKVLEEYGARATFFMCGSRVNDSNKNCLKKEIELGCELGNHTYDHKNYGNKVTASDIKKSSEAIKNACGKYPSIFRCPGGIMSSEIQEECRRESMPIAYWSVDTEDWKTRDADKIYKTALKSVYDGSIILMHDIYPTTAEAVKKLVPKLIEEGYQVVTVSEMLTVKNNGKAPKAGQQYVDYKTVNNNT